MSLVLLIKWDKNTVEEISYLYGSTAICHVLLMVFSSFFSGLIKWMVKNLQYFYVLCVCLAWLWNICTKFKLISVISSLPKWNLRMMLFYYSDNSTTVESSKLEDDAPDEEEDGQRRRKRPRRVQAKESLYQGGIFQVHPLKILVHVYEDEDSDSKSAKLLTLRFEYMVKLNVVCVGIEGCNEGPENDILCNLFPNDTGLELPQQVLMPFTQLLHDFFFFPYLLIYSLTIYIPFISI